MKSALATIRQGQTLLRTRALSVCTDSERTLVHHLDWEIIGGTCWTLIGANGVGKSTLLATLCGLHKPAAGEISIHNRNVAELPAAERARQLSWLPQSHQRQDAFGYRAIDLVLASLRVAEPDGYWDSPRHLADALALLESLQVAALAWQDMRQLSGGERQRVALAATLAQQTPLLLLDEPESALDPAHRALLQTLLRRLVAEQNKGILFACHDLNLAWRCATHALILLPEGNWLAGPLHEVWNAASLSLCFGYPVRALTDRDSAKPSTFWIADHDG